MCEHDERPSDHSGGLLLSVLTVPGSFISIRPEQNIRHPVRGSSHLLTDHFLVNSGVTFDDQFIVDVTNDKAMAKSFHSVAEDVAADSLDDILHELRSIGFNAFPLLCRADAFISDGFSSELIGYDPGLHICEPPS